MGSRYYLSFISGDLLIYSSIFTPKFLETLENNYINPERYNSIDRYNYSPKGEDGAAKELDSAQKDSVASPDVWEVVLINKNGKPKEPEHVQENNGKANEGIIISESFKGDPKYKGWLLYRNGRWFQLMSRDGRNAEELISVSHPEFKAFMQEWEDNQPL